MRNTHAQHKAPARPRDAWVAVSAFAIAVFTVFVLLDTFAIARVQQVVQEADLSNIVAAQEAAGDAQESADAEDGASSGSAGGAEDAASASSGAAQAGEKEADASAGESSHSGSGKHGGKPGSGGGKGHGGKRSGGGGGTPSGDHGSKDTTASDTANDTIEEGAGAASSGESAGTYSDENLQISVSKVRAYDTDIYVADVQVSSVEYLKTALAQNAFGRNLKDATSDMAEDAGAVLAINGDYYGFRDDGYVVRNGVLYRDTAAVGTDALVVNGDGSMTSASQDSVTAQQLVDAGAWQVLSFGPTLVQDGQLAVSSGDEVDQSMGSNPRTAIGMVSPLHYVVVVSGGRTGDNAGLTLYQLAQVMKDNGATYAYNLDGGGSTTMWFQGQVLNDPASGNRSGEREVSDIVYFG